MASAQKVPKKNIDLEDDQPVQVRSTSKTPQVGNLNIKEFICPYKIDPTDFNKIKLMLKTPKFLRTFFVSTLPRFLTFSEFLRPLYNFSNSNTSIHISPINQGVAQSNLSSVINQLQEEKTEAHKLGDYGKLEALQYKIDEASTLRDEISTDFNRLFEIAVLSTLFSNSLEELDALSELLAVEMSKNMVNIRSVWSQQEEALASSFPYGKNRIFKNNTFDTFGLATIFPFISTDISHPTGVPIGINKKSGLPILMDTFNPSYSNYNLLLFGRNASGKRVAIQLLSLRSYVLAGIQSVALDAEARYCKIADSLGGINMIIGPESKVILNPFDVESELIKDDITGKERLVINLQNKINDVVNLLMTMARSTIMSDFPNEATRRILTETVAEEYSELGINNSPESLFSAHGANLVGTKIVRHKKPSPTIGSWYKRLCNKANANSNPDYKYHYDCLINNMRNFVGELGGSIPYFDGQTTLELPEECPFINFDLSKLDTIFERPLAEQVLLAWLWEKYFKSNSEDRSKADKKRVIVDEAFILLPYPEAVDFLNIMAERSAKRNVSLTVVSKRFDEFYKNGKVNDLLNNTSFKLFMQQDESEVDYVKQIFRLTNGETDFLRNCLKGEGILQIGTNTAQIYIAPTGMEIELVEANPSSFRVMGRSMSE